MVRRPWALTPTTPQGGRGPLPRGGTMVSPGPEPWSIYGFGWQGEQDRLVPVAHAEELLEKYHRLAPYATDSGKGKEKGE